MKLGLSKRDAMVARTTLDLEEGEGRRDFFKQLEGRSKSQPTCYKRGYHEESLLTGHDIAVPGAHHDRVY